MQQADELLTYFACHSRQGKRYGLIVKKLTRAAVEYHESLQQRQPNTRSLKMPEIFRLNPPPLKFDQLKPAFEIAGRETQPNTIFQNIEGQDVSPMPNRSPLPDSTQALADTGHFFELADLTSLGDLEDFHVDLERAGDIWALDWSDPLL